jgi:peptidoglycan hydrolase-like protein with peptidoglycan-binding domain
VIVVGLTAFVILTIAAVVLAGQGVVNNLASDNQSGVQSIVTTTVDATPVLLAVGGDAVVSSGYSRSIAGTLSAGANAIFTRDGIGSGHEVNVGTVLAVVNELPTIAMVGAIPAYRSIGVGDVGEDVRQLQRNLNSLGYSTPESGTFSSSTATAVWALSNAAGFTPVDAAGSPVPASRKSQAGVPLGAVHFFPSLPGVTTSQCGLAGEKPDASVCTVDGGGAVLAVYVAAADAALVKTGMRANVDLNDGTRVSGVVGAIAPTATPDSPDSPDSSEDTAGNKEAADTPTGTRIEVTLDGATSIAYGAEGRGTIVVAESTGADLSVEAAAIRSDGTGKIWLMGKGESRIDITLGVCGGGRCVVEGKDIVDGLVVRLSAAAPNE